MSRSDGIFGLVLAGGRSRRFGREKATAQIGGKAMLARVCAVLARGTERVAINAPDGSGAVDLAQRLALTVVYDATGYPQGPLAGVLAGLAWAEASGASWLATAPCDTPFLPEDLVARLSAPSRLSHDVVLARTEDGLQPLCAVWRVERRDVVADALARDHPRVRDVLTLLRPCEVRFETPGAFVNVNTPDDFAAACLAFEAQMTLSSSSTMTMTTINPRPPEG